MSTHPEQENIQALRRLLALKRHEQPPPGYFNRFPTQVIARIQAGERAPDTFWERFSLDASWMGQLWSALETKPILAGAFGVAVCGLITSGFFFSDNPSNLESAPFAVFTPNGNQHPVLQTATPAASLFNQVPGESAGPGNGDGIKASLFQQFQEQRPRALTIPVTFQGGN